MTFDFGRVAVAGMGVSGLAIGKAVTKLGGNAVVFDQKLNDSPSVLKAVDELDAAGVEAVTGWHGRLDPADFDLLVVSPGFPQNHPAIRDILGGGKEVWSEIEFAYRIAKAPVLAITGTNGKSTTTVLLWLLLTGAGKKALLCGNIAGSGYPEQTLTDAAMVAGPDDFLVSEVSSYQLEWVHEFRPRVAAITNITPDHMDRYKLFGEYFNTKLRLFHYMGAGDTAVVNLDEASLPVSTLRPQIPEGVELIGFSPAGKAIGNGSTNRTGDTLTLSGTSVQISDLPLLGEHNVTNAMMAWEMATSVSAPNAGMLDALRSFKGLANRMERLGEKSGVLVVNNSMCTNPAAVIASSRSLDRPLHLLVGGVTKNLDFRPVGEYLADSPHLVYVFGPEPERINEMLGRKWPYYATMEFAFEAACNAALSGEAVMLAPGCASAEPYANFKERGDAFKVMAQKWLESP